ncbi:hypothetical protein DPMN_062651 [Dreissena polymorpha]|uniref:Uncharacterized protein n=1 Tax=Dreissena polymorpha TaxID=45954 RepID=A0A9D4HJI9_DREPO|nr:hypothetical protein DPMN_062651 [Dreissena polymorpha]
MLADTAFQATQTSSVVTPDIVSLLSTPPSTSSCLVSPVLREALVYPKAPETLKPVRKTLLKTLPDNQTSTESIRTMSLKQLEKITKFTERELKAKVAYLKKQAQISKKNEQKKGGSAANPKKGKGPLKGEGCLKRKVENVVPQEETSGSSMSKDFCKACLTTWVEDIASGENLL